MISLQLKNSIQIQVTFFTEIEIANKKSMFFRHVPFTITSFLVYQFKNINNSINADKFHVLEIFLTNKLCCVCNLSLTFEYFHICCSTGPTIPNKYSNYTQYITRPCSQLTQKEDSNPLYNPPCAIIYILFYNNLDRHCLHPIHQYLGCFVGVFSMGNG